MKNDSRWKIVSDNEEYSVEYFGTTLNGKVKIAVNGETNTYTPILVRGFGLFAPFKCGNKDCILKIGTDTNEPDLIIDGNYINSKKQSELDFSGLTNPHSTEFKYLQKLQQNIRSGMGSFLTLILLTLVNDLLILIDASVSLLFSLFTPGLVLILGNSFTQQTGATDPFIVGILISLLILSVFTLLYFLSSRYIWPIWTAFVLSLADTVVLVIFAMISGEATSFILDFAFHIWIIWALIRLAVSKKRLSDALAKKIVV